jgi:hypothetical protein
MLCAMPGHFLTYCAHVLADGFGLRKGRQILCAAFLLDGPPQSFEKQSRKIHELVQRVIILLA